jgi:hypothetical protein
MTRRHHTHSHPASPDAAFAPNTPVAPRKPFVKPIISSPVDVLAATTFFQVVDSGGTLRRPRND